MKSTERAEPLLHGDIYRLLLQIALLGAEVGDAAATLQIAEVLQHARPDLPHARAVLAMGHLNQGHRDEAVRELESTLQAFPDFQLGKALLGVCMKVGGHTGWQHHLDAVIDDGRDEFAVGMACEVLGRPNPASEEARSEAWLSQPSTTHVVWA